MLGKVLMMGAVSLGLVACATEPSSTGAVQGTGYIRDSIETASRAACQAYGIDPRAERYKRCVRNENAARAPG